MFSYFQRFFPVLPALLIPFVSFAAYNFTGIRFIENKGQWSENILFRADIQGGRLFVEHNTITYALLNNEDLVYWHENKGDSVNIQLHAVKIDLLGASATTEVVYKNKFRDYYNFFIGNDPSRWAGGVNAYQSILLKEIYPGIDLEFTSSYTSLKYNYYISAGTDPNLIRMQYRGTDKLKLEDGDLIVQTSVTHMKEKKPIAWQIIDGHKVYVDCSFMLENEMVSFALGDYNTSLPLIIDPEVIFSTFSGSISDNWGFTATYDKDGNAYSGGTVYGPDFPVTPGAYQHNFMGGQNYNTEGDHARDIGLLKFNSDGTQLLFATYIGGIDNEQPHSLIVNNNNELLVFGTTLSPDFPVTSAAFDTVINGNYDIFIAKFRADGTELLASTFIGGSGKDGLNGDKIYEYPHATKLVYNYSEEFRGEIIVDNNDNILVATITQSPDFPVSQNAFQKTYGGGLQDGVVFKLSAGLDSMIWSTFIGGTQPDAAYSLALDQGGNVVVGGGTESNNFPVTIHALHRNYIGGDADGWVAILSADGSQLLRSTYIGTNKYDQVFFVDTDPFGNVFIMGQTSGSFPVSEGVYRNEGSGQFIARMKTNFSGYEYSSVFGSGRSQPDLAPSAFLVDECGNIFFSGWGGRANRGNPTSSTIGFPVTPNAIQHTTDGSDFYVSVFSNDLKQLVFASFFGGPVSQEHVDGGTSRFDEKGVVYQSVCGGCGRRSDFPTTPGAWSNTNNSDNCNNAVFKILVGRVKPRFDFTVDSCSFVFTFHDHSINSFSWRWDFGDGNTSKEPSPRHTYQTYGTYNVMLVVNEGTVCQDTAYKQIFITPEDLQDIVIPNVFTPDGDGLNDYFTIKGLDIGCYEFEFVIFNRWGQRLYEVVNSRPNWDGKFKGESLPAGTYYYNFLSSRLEQTGTITLIR